MVDTESPQDYAIYPPPSSVRSKSQHRVDNPNTRRLTRSQVNAWKQSEDPQSFCPLLTKLADEVRFMIYNYVLTAVDDQWLVALSSVTDAGHHAGHVTSQNRLPREIYRLFLDPDQDQYYYAESAGLLSWKSAKRARRRHSTHNPIFLSLLRTCQFIYTEARHLVVSINTHILRYAILNKSHNMLPAVARDHFEQLPKHLIHHVRHVHMFAAAPRIKTTYDEHRGIGYMLDTPLAELCIIRHGGGINGQTGRYMRVPFLTKLDNLTTLTITVRDDEWCWTGKAGPKIYRQELAESLLHEGGTWDAVFGGLQRLTLELEIQSNFAEELKTEIVERLAGHEFCMSDGSKLVPRQCIRGQWTRDLTSNEDEAIRVIFDH